MSQKLTQKVAHQFSKFSINDVSKAVREAQYAVRGRVPQRALQIQQEIQSGQGNWPFKELTEANIGNPQTFGQPPLTFNREVLSGIINPSLVKQGAFSNKDVVDRVEMYRSKIVGNVGAYTVSHGYQFGREAVSDFIQRRDGTKEKTDLNNIILSNGASEGVNLIMETFISSAFDGAMIPIPQYPLYSALIALKGGSQINYLLKESDKWSVSLESLQDSYREAKSRGVTPKLLCVINPGNPTGTLLTRDNIEDMIKFANNNNMVIIADEVYQENVYTQENFLSFRKVMYEMPAPYNQTQLASVHSTSKGIMGECGFRGGYLEILNLDPEVQAQIIKLKSIGLCSNTVGQLTTEMMCNHPRENAGFRDETVEQYQNEVKNLFTGLQSRSLLITNVLNSMQSIDTQPAEGAMYAFPSIHFSQKAIEEAAKKGMPADLFYCLEVLENTGLVLVPGSGFGQKKDTYHFRITNLIRPESKMKQRMEIFAKFNAEFHARYE